MAYISGNDPDAADKMREMFGPNQVDESIRRAIHMCWMTLPSEKRNIDEVDRQIRRLVDRALKDLREDSEAFGMGDA